MISLTIENVAGLPEIEYKKLQKLVDVFNYHVNNNAKKEKYYEGAVTLNDVNLGLALPDDISKLQVGCDWGSKAVDVLAARSMFDGFVSSTGEDVSALANIIAGNNLISQYITACKDQLKFGCTFATLSGSDIIGCKIRFHSPQTAAALWNGDKGRLDCGFAIIDTVPDEKELNVWRPAHINYYTDDAIYELRYAGPGWIAKKHPHKMGQPLMLAMIWNRTSKKPFGRSRLKYSVRALIDGYIRTVANAAIALEFSTTPQKYLLGITDDQYEAVIGNKFKQYVGSIIAATQNPETGENPTFGQLAQGSLQPHAEMLRIVSTQFSAATGLSVSDTGVVNDSNPSSAEAIQAQSQTLVLLAEQLNVTNGDTLKLIGRMAQAIARNVTLEELTPEENDVIAHFKNPAMPSVSVTADAAIKIASARPDFAGTDTFLEMIGFDQANIRRIKSQEQRTRGQRVLTEVEETEV